MVRRFPFLHSLVGKLLLSLCVIFIPLIVIQIVNNHYAIQIIKSQVSQSNKNMLNLYMNQIDQNLDRASDYIYELANEGDLYYFQKSITTDYNEYVEAKLRLFQSISKQSNYYATVDSIFAYSQDHREFINTRNFGKSYIDRQTAAEEITKLLEEDVMQLEQGKWEVIEREHQNYLFYYLETDDVYLGAWVNMEELIFPFELIDFGDSGGAAVVTSDFKAITSDGLLDREGINLKQEPDTYIASGNNEDFLVMSEHSSTADFNIIALIPEQIILENMPLLQRIGGLLVFIAILFLTCLTVLMRRVFLLPINQIVTAMKKLQQGDLNIRLPQKRSSSEFEMMNESFNDMISEISDLTISVYEEKLNVQQAELKHLQLQINPHFFLNSLNIIYNLATVKDFHLVQEMSKNLSNYFRFMIRSNSYFVTIDDEIKHTDNYLKIQELRFPDTFFYNLFVPDELKVYKIPPLLIQSLVENSIKHAFNMDNPIEIYVTVTEGKKDKEFLFIDIEDTGEGFSRIVLDKLNKDIPLINKEGEQVGIWNVKHRLKLLYDGKASIHFLNKRNSGAVVQIRIPKKKE